MALRKNLRKESEALREMVRERDRENAALNEKIRQLRYEACVQDEEKAALLKKVVLAMSNSAYRRIR